jgi:hypothetical protein
MPFILRGPKNIFSTKIQTLSFIQSLIYLTHIKQLVNLLQIPIQKRSFRAQNRQI